MALDFKKTQKELYNPKTTPSIVDVPQMTFIKVDGQGDPNTSAEYSSAVELLYSLSYNIKMNNKKILDYVVLPLEGFWDWDESKDKTKFKWTALIRQPDFVNAQIFEKSKEEVKKKKDYLDVNRATLITIEEGLCVQAMHIGSYDDEERTIKSLHSFAEENGYAIDIGENRRHHEIYL